MSAVCPNVSSLLSNLSFLLVFFVVCCFVLAPCQLSSPYNLSFLLVFFGVCCFVPNLSQLSSQQPLLLPCLLSSLVSAVLYLAQVCFLFRHLLILPCLLRCLPYRPNQRVHCNYSTPLPYPPPYTLFASLLLFSPTMSTCLIVILYTFLIRHLVLIMVSCDVFSPLRCSSSHGT